MLAVHIHALQMISVCISQGLTSCNPGVLGMFSVFWELEGSSYESVASKVAVENVDHSMKNLRSPDPILGSVA